MAKRDEDNVDFETEGKLSTDEILDIIGELPPERAEPELPVIEDGFLSEDEIDAILNLGGDAGDERIEAQKAPEDDDEADFDFLDFDNIDTGEPGKSDGLFGEAEEADNGEAASAEDIEKALANFNAETLAETPGAGTSADILNLEDDFDALLAEISSEDNSFDGLNEVNEELPEKIEEVQEREDIDVYGDVDDEISFDLDEFNDEGFEIYEKVDAIESDLEKARDFDIEGDFASEEELAFVSDVTVYENFDRDDPFSDAVKKAEEEAVKNAQAGKDTTTVVKNVADGNDEENEGEGLLGNVSSALTSKININVILLGVLVVLLFGSVIAGGTIISRLQNVGKPADASFAQADSVLPPKVMYNNGNYVYLDVSAVGLSDAIVLTKFHSDQEASAFYFRNDVVWSDYDVSLRDDLGKQYQVDLHIYQEGYASKKLLFEPLDVGIKGISLVITEKATGEAEEFIYQFENGLSLTTAAYLKSSRMLAKEGDTSFNINHATFNSTGTDITYDVTWEGNERLNFTTLSIYEGSKRIMADESTHEQYIINDGQTMIGKVELGPVTMLNGTVSVELNDVYKVYDLNQRIDLVGLTANMEEAQMRLPAGQHVVTLERFGRVGNNYILVLNGETKDGVRMETYLDGALVLTMDEGPEVRIEADVRSAAIGTDMLFDISDVEGTVVNYEFDLNSIYVKTDDIRAKIDLNELPRSKENALNGPEAGGIEYLEEQGYTAVQNTLYYKAGGTVYLKYIGLRNGELREAYLIGEQDGLSWNFRNWNGRTRLK